jgi:DNA-binding transcriptional LysR family regulator
MPRRTACRKPRGAAAAPVITSGVVGKQLRLRGYQGELRQEVMLEPTIISEHFPFLRQGILAGLGVGLVPDYVVQDAVTSGEVLTTLDEWRLSIFGTDVHALHARPAPDARGAHLHRLPAGARPAHAGVIQITYKNSL